jgi:hypothetical protein
MNAKKSVSMKALVLLLAAVLLFGCAAGGTLAYLMAKTDPVTNTFVAGDIGSLELKETTGDNYLIIPGVDIKKDPVVTFNGIEGANNNIAAYVFLKIDADGWTVDGTTYTISNKMSWTLDCWTKLTDGVYYKEVVANAGKQSWPIIKDNTITVSSEITATDIADYAKNLSSPPMQSRRKALKMLQKHGMKRRNSAN